MNKSRKTHLHPPKHTLNIKHCTSCRRVSPDHNVVPNQQCGVEMNLQVTGSGGVSGRTFGWKVKVGVGAVEEGFPPLAVREIGLYDHTRAGAGLGVQGAAAHSQSILHIKAENKGRTEEEDVLRLDDSRHILRIKNKHADLFHSMERKWKKHQSWSPTSWFRGCLC